MENGVPAHFHKEDRISEKDLVPNNTVLGALPVSAQEGERAVIENPADTFTFYQYLKGAWRSIIALLDILTTKGDLLTRGSSGYVRLPVGANGKVLKANSAQAEGIEWGDANSMLLTAGEDLAANDAVGLGKHNTAKDYSQTQSDADATYHNWVSRYIDGSNPTNNSAASNLISVGFRQSGGPHDQQSFIYIDMADIPNHFTKVILRLYADSFSNASAIQMQVRNVTQSWDTVAGSPINRSNITYNNQPSINTSTPWADVVVNATGQYWDFDITALVLYWKSGLLANYGLVMAPVGVSTPNASLDSFVNFKSIRAGSNVPMLRIDGLEDVNNVYKTDNADPVSIFNHIGFMQAAANAAASCSVQETGLLSGFSGLTPGENYFVKDAASIGLAKDAANSFGALLLAGRSLSATQLKIERGRKVMAGTVTFPSNSSYAVILTYFRPTSIEFFPATNGNFGFGVAFELNKMSYVNDLGPQQGADKIYSDGTKSVDVIAIGNCATLVHGYTSAGNRTLYWIARG